MNARLLFAFFILGNCSVRAETFPGLQSVLTEAEWKRAGLDKLSPDQLGVIDAALIRYLAQRPSMAPVATGSMPAEAAPSKPGWLQRFGLPTFDDDWRNAPPLRAKVVAWESANRFRLDNGQIWEGFEPIRYELVGKEIEIQARRNNQFALFVEGKNTTVRVYRLR
jgi:hypothetical protein